MEQEFETKTNEKVEQLLDFMEELEIEQAGINVEEITNDTFKIATKEQANFFLKKLEEVRGQKKEVTATAAIELMKVTTRVEAWRDKELKSLDSNEQFFLGLLEQFTLAEQAKTKTDKKIKLPYGTMGYRKVQPKYVYDDTALLKYLQNKKLTQFIRAKEEPNKAGLKASTDVKVQDGHMLFNNEIIVGVEIIPQEPVFEVK